MYQTILLISSLINLTLHLAVLFRLWLPELDYLVSKRYYFIFDLGIPFLTLITFYDNFYFIDRIYILCTTLAHIYYVVFWHTGFYAKRIQNWTSREYTGKIITWDFLLTFFDCTTHIIIIITIVKMMVS